MEIKSPLFEISDPDNISIYLDVSDAERRLEYNDIKQSGALLVDSQGWLLDCMPLHGDHGALRIIGRSNKNIIKELESCVLAYVNTHSEHFSKIFGVDVPQNLADLIRLIRDKRLWI